jgi:hypothetical protein
MADLKNIEFSDFDEYEMYYCHDCECVIFENYPHCEDEKTGQKYCRGCSFINGFIDDKTFLQWSGVSLDTARAVVKDGKIYAVLYGKFEWEKKSNADRFTNEYKWWRTAVFERDKFTCQKCGAVGGELNAHHIKPYAKYKELRYELSNGITLCKNCHKLLHKRRK